jgi:para-nitrobenzyl esterase
VTPHRETAAATFLSVALSLATYAITPAAAQSAGGSIPVDVHNFVRAETDMYFGGFVQDGHFGKLGHTREPVPIDKQNVVRMNRDTLYSNGVFDLDAGPVTITLPDAGKRFMSLQVLSEDHYTIEVVYGPGSFTYDRAKVGTRYVAFLIRTLADAEDAADIASANALQDAIRIEQAQAGAFETPEWDKASRDKIREALSVLASLGTGPDRFGRKEEVDPIDFLIGTAIGWGGNPRYAADYASFYPSRNDGQTVYRLTVKDVPVDGFWSISIYNEEGLFERNDLNAYSLNNLTAKANADGSVAVQFGGCDGKIANCLPTVKGWNYTVRLYRPRKEILDGTWTFPEAQPAG